MSKPDRTAGALVGCGRRANGGAEPCVEVTARLIAAERDQRDLGIDTSELRRRAEQIARVHLSELAGRR